MTAVPNGFASPAYAATKLPLYDQSNEAIYLRQFILNCQLAVKANEVKKHRMLKDAIHAHIQTCFGEAMDAMVDDAAHALYEKLCACPEDELEADSPDPYDLDLPPPATD